jgi:hypothetical protein
MPIIQAPPAAPKKETLAIRLEVRVLDELRRYAAFLGTKNFSHIIACSLERVFKADAGYKAWLKAHPDFQPQAKTSRNGRAASDHIVALANPPSPAGAKAGERQVGSRNSIGGA